MASSEASWSWSTVLSRFNRTMVKDKKILTWYNTCGFPITIRSAWALVIATLNLLGLLRKPRVCFRSNPIISSFERTCNQIYRFTFNLGLHCLPKYALWVFSKQLLLLRKSGRNSGQVCWRQQRRCAAQQSPTDGDVKLGGGISK